MFGKKNKTSDHINKLRLLIGGTALFAGGFIYLINRPPDSAYFIYRYGPILSLHRLLPEISIPFGNSLPEFIHAFSFILITASVISNRERGELVIAFSWCIIDCVFELAQRYKVVSLSLIPDWFEKFPVLGNCRSYILHGTFDLRDMIAIFLGSLTAYLILLTTMRKNGMSLTAVLTQH